MLAGSIYNVIPDELAKTQVPSPKFYPNLLAAPSSEDIGEDIFKFGKDKTIFPKDRHPAVTPRPNILFKAQDDAERLHKAIEGIGTDEDTIIRILTKRSLDQRLQIAEAYKTMFGFVLSYHIVLETSGKFRDLLNALLTPLPLLYARDLRDAIIGIGTTESVLIEIICSLTNHEIKAVKRTYKAVFKTKLEDDIRSDTSDEFQELLITLLKANRSEELVVRPDQVKEDARRLLYASDHDQNPDEEFLHIITSRSIPQLAAIVQEFKTMTNQKLEDYIWEEFSGDVAEALFTMVEIARDGHPSYFARLLHKSMSGLGTNDAQLIRIMVTRSEIDLHDIAAVFRKRYKEKLAAWIEDDCYGEYKECLLCLLGAKEKD